MRALLVRMRLRAKCEIEPEEHTSVLVFGGATDSRPISRARASCSTRGSSRRSTHDELERRRIEAGVPRWGREIDERILPAEAGLDATHVDFGKGCYPGQEPVARLHYRGHPEPRPARARAGRSSRTYDAELVHDGKAVGRVTSAATREDGTVVALAYVRTEVPADAQLELAHATA